MRKTTSRMYFKDDWHCGNHGCGCWQTKDIERDKDMLKKIIARISSGDFIEVHYHEYRPGPDEGKEARDRYIYTVSMQEMTIKEVKDLGFTSVYMPQVWEAMFHGFMLTGASAHLENKKPTLHLDFERVGIYEEKE